MEKGPVPKLWLQLLEGSFKLIYKDPKEDRPVVMIDHNKA
jgi:hypothetical protein